MKSRSLFLLAPVLLGVTFGAKSRSVLAEDTPANLKAVAPAPLTGRQLLARDKAPQVGGQLRLLAAADLDAPADDSSDAAQRPTSAGTFSALKHTDVKAHISGSVAYVDVTQEFTNPSKVPVEAIYTFPLPEKAAVNGMEFRVGGRVIVGQIKERQQARQIYNQAKQEGKRTALLDQERPNIFTQSVANIMPGDQISVHISFVQPLDYRDGAYEWAFPTVVGPRYTGTGTPDGNAIGVPTSYTPDAEQISPPFALPGTRSGHDISLHVSVDAGVPLGDIRSVLHPIDVQREGTNRAQIELKNEGTIPNRDFILRFAVAGQKFQSGLLTQSDGKGGGYFALVMQPPATPKREDVSPRELVFVVDQTGSQSGFPIEKSKEAMREALKYLRPNDHFQVLAFNTDVFPCFSQPVVPTVANLANARKFVDGLNAGGGTDILKALGVALKIPLDPQRLRAVVYFTDGFVGNDQEIIDFERQNRGTTRVFPFGVGNSVNRSLLDSMAREGRGSVEYITLGLSRAEFERELDTPIATGTDLKQLRKNLEEQKSALEAINRFNSRIKTPVLISPSVQFNGLPVTDVLPDPINDVFETQPIIITGRYTKASKGFVTLSGYSGQHAWEQNIPVDFSAAPSNNPGLESLWARARVDAITNSDTPNAEDKKAQIIEVALEHKLLTQYTSFVAVEQKIVNPGGQNQSNDVPSEVPEGLDAEKSGATNGPRYGVSNTQNGTFAAQPGDPLIQIKAPADTLSVLAILPDGTPLPLRRDAKSGRWEARFDIPTYAPDGPYAVQIVMTRQGGKRQRLSLLYRVDTKAPTGSAKLGAGRAMITLQAGDDVERVLALMPWGERLQLQRDGRTFSAPVQTPVAFSSRQAVVTLILTDHAHNRTEISLDWN